MQLKDLNTLTFSIYTCNFNLILFYILQCYIGVILYVFFLCLVFYLNHTFYIDGMLSILFHIFADLAERLFLLTFL